MRRWKLGTLVTLCASVLVGCSDDGAKPAGGASGRGGGSNAGSGGNLASGGTSGSLGSAGTNAAGTGNNGNAGGSAGVGAAGGEGTTIGTLGGKLTIDGASVFIPAGALSSEQEIRIAVVDAPTSVPSNYALRSPIYAFTPHGLSFLTAVSMSLNYTGEANTVLRLDNDADTTWEPVAGPSFSDGKASFETTGFSYYVVAQAQAGGSAVMPLYPSAPNFNAYVKNDGADRFRATGVACDNQWWNNPQVMYSECIHSGEHRAVAVTGRSSCTGLTATDALSAFDWTCEVLSGTATMVSTGFKEGAGLSTLVDFATGAWKTNSVTVSDGASAVLTTAPEVWWNNPIEIDNDGVLTATASKIYLVTQNSEAPYKLNADGAALVVKPGNTLSGSVVTDYSSRVVLDGFGIYFEGSISGSGSRALYLGGSHFYVRNTKISGFDSGIGTVRRARIENTGITCAPGGTGLSSATGAYIRNLKTSRCGHGALIDGALSVIENVMVSGGMLDIIGSNLIAAGVTAHHSDSFGIGIGLGEGVLLMHATTMHNLSHGLRSYNTSGDRPRQIIGLLTTENRDAGISLDYNAIIRNAGIFANTHHGVWFDYRGTDGNVFLGALSIGLNGNRPGNYYSEDPAGCYNASTPALGDCANSRASTSSGSPNGLLTLADGQCNYDTNSNVTSPFNPPIRGIGYPLPERIKSDDAVNPSDGPDGNAAYANISNFIDFENFYRGWGAEGSATPSCESQGPCSPTSTGPAGCQIFDYRLRHDADTFIARSPNYPDGNSTYTHRFAATGTSSEVLTEAMCKTLFKHAVFDVTTKDCTVTFLANAREILGDMRGNDNLLCESNETCLYTPNIASYQGEGALRAPKDFTFVNGTIENVTLLEFETNGTTMPYSP